ncbi:MAG: arginase family protein [Deltaproteobacteria bacterium]|nr:arginase family protein [Candidatus Zymogenaceae bacterium]
MTGPAVTIDLQKVEKNARVITGLCGGYGINVTGVTKVTCGMPQVARAMLRGGVIDIGESRMENIRRLKVSGINAPMMLLRIPPLSEVDEIVTSVDVSLNSELSVIEGLSDAALRRSLVHDIILMVDLGDLREGIWPDDLADTAGEVKRMRGVRVVGIGTNLSCYGGVIPTRRNMKELVSRAGQVEEILGYPLSIISGGNTSSLPLIAEGKMPERVNHLRVGEGILLGRETIHRTPLPYTSQDAFTLDAEVIELKEKPSIPIGERGEDAFGRVPLFPGERRGPGRLVRRLFKGAGGRASDGGHMIRAILNVGREDVDIEGLSPADSRQAILGASSDHLIVDVTQSRDDVRLGRRLSFHLNYAALLAAMTSSFVEKRPIMTDEDRRDMRGVKILGVPSWVGSLVPTVEEAPKALRDAGLIDRLTSLGLHVIDDGDIPVDRHVTGDDQSENLREIVRIAGMVAERIEAQVKDRYIPLVLGGDDTASLGLFWGLKRALGSFGLFWFDAHGDFLATGKAGDERLCRSVLGSVLCGTAERNGAEAANPTGDPLIDSLISGGVCTDDEVPALDPENVVVLGLRDVTSEEARRIGASGITVITMEDIDSLGMKEVVYRGLRAAGAGTNGIYLSLDIDVIDPQAAPGVIDPARGGLTYRETHLAMELLAASGLVVAMDVTGINPERDIDGTTVYETVEFILSAFGKKILGR